jgi:hypothetical protein
MNSRRVVLRIGLLSLVSCGWAWAQNTGSIAGTVKDTSGAAVPDAGVVITSPDHGIHRQAVTNSIGDYNVFALPGGSYDVIVTATGFTMYRVKGVVLDVAQKASVNVVLKVGTVSTEVNVDGAAVAQVETQSSDQTTTVNGKEISQLLLNGRDYTQLITLAPGVNNQTGQDEGTVGIGGNTAYSVNGGRTEYNNWELDGGDTTDNGNNALLNVTPSIESIAEFKVLTSNYSAQYGRNASGTIEVETKSGTNKFHGDVYEFVRNDAFNAQNFFNSPNLGGSGVTPEYKKNDFGYSIGGPVYIPGVYNKDKKKTFFFWSEEWRRDVVPGQIFHQPVPSLAERGGDFGDLCTAANNYTDCPVVPGYTDSTGHTPNLNIVPAFQSNAGVASGLLAEISKPTGANPMTCVACFFSASPAQPTNWREELIRVDHNFTDKTRLTVRYIHDSWEQQTASPLWSGGGSFPTLATGFTGPGVALLTRLTTTISPTLLNEFVANYTTDRIILKPLGNWQRPSNFRLADIFPGNGGGVLPGISLIDPAGVYGNFAEDMGITLNGGPYNSNPTYVYRDNLFKTVGRHSLALGAYFVAAQKNEKSSELGGYIEGYLIFDPTRDLNTSGNPFADLLLGNVYSFSQQDAVVKYYNRYKILEPYVNDDWRITDRLTINLGLRISLFGTYRERYHQAFNFDPAFYVQGQTAVDQNDIVHDLTANGLPPSVSNLPNGIVQCGVTPGVPVGCAAGHLFNPAPRVGFAWNPWGDGNTSIRGGYGIFFDHTNGNEGNTESLENSPPLVNVQQQFQIAGYGNTGSQAQFPLSIVALSNKTQWPYVQQWNLSVQREVFHNTVATIAYVGSKGTHLTLQSDLNQLHPTPLSQDPYKIGEASSPSDCGSTFDAYGVPTQATTLSGVPIPYAVNSRGLPIGPAVNLGVAVCGTLAPPLRPYPGYDTITNLRYAASSNYNSLQASLRRTLGQLTLSAAYSYSHSIDDSSDRSDGNFVNSYDFASNRASSNFDERHIFNFSYVWDLPFFKTPGLNHTLLGGWQFSGITLINSGPPFSVNFNGDNAGVANGVGSTSRVDRVGDPRSGIVQVPNSGFGRVFYNAAAFAAPRGLSFGDAGRNFLNDVRRINFDMALFKHFAIKENLALEFRTEAFNVFNHPELNFINGSLGSPGFLAAGGAHNPRILQLGLKLLF